MKGVIYCYHCIPTGKKYIGQTINEERRKYEHNQYCKRGIDKKFYRAVRKYGWENFIYGVIDTLDENLLDEKETFYIQKYNSLNNGYNATFGGKSTRGIKLSESHKQKIRLATKGKKSGKNNNFYNKKHSIELKERWSEERKNIPYWNNGQKSKRSVKCPGEGWVRGTLKKGKWWNNGTKNILSKEYPGNDWKPGKITDKTYIFISPEGNELEVKSLSSFCLEYELDYRTVLRLLKKEKKYQSHKGWKFKCFIDVIK